MSGCPIKGEGKTLKKAVKALDHELHKAELMCLHKDGDTLATHENGKWILVCRVSK
jgi:hypothetical protein